MSEQLGGFGFRDRAFRQGTEAQALETHGLLAGHSPRLLVRRTAPAATGEFIEKQSKQGIAEDPEILAPVRERLHADAEQPLEIEELSPAHGTAALANLDPERFGRHEEGPGEAVSGLLVVNLRWDIEDHVAEFMRDGEALALTPVPLVDDDPDRNPGTMALIAEFYAILQEQPDLRSIVFDRDDSVSRQATGQGCGSLTMTMSDGRLSLFAAGMSEYLLARQREGLPDAGGEILVGRLSKDGIGLAWRAFPVAPVTIVRTTNGETWRVHVHARAMTKMQDEASRWPNVETGGVLVGRLSEVSRVAHVVDVLEAPEDSRSHPETPHCKEHEVRIPLACSSPCLLAIHPAIRTPMW